MGVVWSLFPYLNFQHQQLAPAVGNFKEKAMALAKKVVPIVENFEEQTTQEQVAKMMVMVEMSL